MPVGEEEDDHGEIDNYDESDRVDELSPDVNPEDTGSFFGDTNDDTSVENLGEPCSDAADQCSWDVVA